MMEQNREKEVWSRVMAASASAPMPQGKTMPAPKSGGLTEDMLRQLMEAEAMEAHTYRQLAAKSQGNARRTLEQLSAEEQGHFRRLTAIGFLLLGRKLTVTRPEAAHFDTAPETLRNQYRRELDAAGHYRDVARNAEVYGPLFLELADAEERHSQTVVKLLGEML